MRHDRGVRRIAVVGGGVVGCATAYVLAKSGLCVTLLERDAIAAHASGCNAGNLNPLHQTPVSLRPQALEALAVHRQMTAELAALGCALHALKPQARIHLGTRERSDELAATAALFASTAGFAATWLDRRDLAKLEPKLAEDLVCGVLLTGNLTVDGAGLSRSLAAGALRLGATFLNEPALGVSIHGSRVTAVRTPERLLPCDAVVFATGPWTAEIRSWLGVHVPVEPLKGQMLLLRLPTEAPQHDLHLGSLALYRRCAHEVWVGGTAERCGMDAAPTPGAKATLLAGAARILPQVADACLLDHVAALRPTTASSMPIAQRSLGWDNVYIANGGGSKGVLLSVSIAATLRDALLGRGPGADDVETTEYMRAP